MLKQSVILLLASIWITGCSAPASQHDLIGKEVEVYSEPTIVTTSTRSEVTERKWDGKLISVDPEWVVLQSGETSFAINRQKVVSIRTKLPDATANANK